MKGITPTGSGTRMMLEEVTDIDFSVPGWLRKPSGQEKGIRAVPHQISVFMTF